MIRRIAPDLDSATARQLASWTEELVDEPDYTARIALAKAKFKARNTRKNKTFERVKEALSAMCDDTHRCVYCEDNLADEVEHIRPKDVYPEQCFAWANYVYACGPCNGPKNNHFAVFDTRGAEVDVTPPRVTPGEPPSARTPPPDGQALLIDPRAEDPMALLALDLDSGGLAPRPGLSAMDRRRAEWTRDTLGLNGRRLPRARLQALDNVVARLTAYATTRNGGAPAPALDALRLALTKMNHPTVFREVQRQPTHPKVRAALAAVPEALRW